MDSNTKSKIESLLFISSKPLSMKQMSKVLELDIEEIKLAIDDLIEEYNGNKRGIFLITEGDYYKFSTSPDNSEFIQNYIKQEIHSELTKPALETLTIIAYRGPISKLDLELIRGVNCSMILRNLMIKGLIKSNFDNQKKLDMYKVTNDFVQFLGISNVTELPNYEKWNSHDIINKILGKVEG